jgi:hypothetical protein
MIWDDRQHRPTAAKNLPRELTTTPTGRETHYPKLQEIVANFGTTEKDKVSYDCGAF